MIFHTRRAVRGPAWILAIAAFWAPLTGSATEAPAAAAEPSRPKIGLALSGGGARGAAHIGVLQVLEEHRIPIDYVAGTSMGAVVGGLYAAGLSVDELVGALNEIDWKTVFSDPTPRRERSFRRKRDDDLYLVKAKPGLNSDGLQFPPGVVQGQKIDLALSRYAQRVTRTNHFDDFMIPFRAVATDIATGDAVVLESGNLPRALRASMSVPAVFSPVEIDNRKLVDGGVANNLPIDVVRDMGADIVIAVDISTPLLGNDDLTSLLAITDQLTSILTRRNTEAQIRSLVDDDILLVPDLGDMTTADFHRAGDAIVSGRRTAESRLGTLAYLGLSDGAYAAYRAGLMQPPTASPVIDTIRIDNNSRVKDSIIENRIVNSRPGQQFRIANAERDVGRIYGLEQFQTVSYALLEEDELNVLEFRVRRRAWGPKYLQLGASYDSNGKGDNIFNLAASYLLTAMNPSNGELRLGVQFGEEPGLFADFHQPLGRKGMYFANLRSSLQETLFTQFEGGNPLAEFRLTETAFEASVGREFGTWGEVRSGVRYADGRAEARVGDPQAGDRLKYQRGEVFTRFAVDELDSFFFPRRGYSAVFQWTASRDGLGADTESFDQLLIDIVAAKSFGRNVLLGGLSFGSTISGEAPIQSLFRRGGFNSLSGYNTGELSGQHYGQFNLVGYRRFGNTPILPIYLGFSLETGNVWADRDAISFGDRIHAGSVFAGAETPIGPIYLAYGMAEGGRDAFYVYLGRGF